MPHVDFLDDPTEFLAVAEDHLAADPVRASVVAVVSERIATAPSDASPPDRPNWWVVARDDRGTVVGAGMRTMQTEPYAAFLMAMPREAAVEVARAVHARGEDLTAVNGDVASAGACAAELARLTGGRVERAMPTRLHEVTELQLPSTPRGSLRQATAAETDLLAAWFARFHAEGAEQAGRDAPVEGTDRGIVGDRIAAGLLDVWISPDGEVVHFTGHSGPAFGVVRIGPVYTPPHHRGHGYAAATVAEVSRRALAAGHRVCLYTDLENPVSNELYARPGYRPVVDEANFVVLPS